MSAGTSEFFCLICLLFCSCTAQKIIRAELGEDVILPCKVPNINDITAVEWIRPELDPDYVLLYRDGRIDPYNQHPSYQNRVDLQDKEMKDGDFSLILKNVMKNDTGTYMCHVSQKGKIELISNITLEVYLSAQTNIRHENITAELGKNVTLPCKVSNKNINIRSVVWRRPDYYPEYVLVYRNGGIDPDHQHPSYQNRVDLKDKEMKDGDASLILKNVKMEDTGRYVCRVFEEGKHELISNITLEVYLSGDKFEGGKGGGDNVGIIVGPVVGVIILAVASVGFLIYRFRSTGKNHHVEVPLDERPVL